MEVVFEKLDASDLIVDCTYKGGKGSSADNEPLHHVFPKCGVNGGFRKVNRTDGSGKPAYVILYTTMGELEWPDYIDEETGIFELLDCLERNERAGVGYHREGIMGDYDDFDDLEVILSEPVKKCA